MLLGQTHILVHVEGNYVLEAYLASLVHLDQVLVQAQGRTTGGATQLEGLLGGGVGSIDACSNVLGGPAAQLGVIRLNDYSHSC